LSFLRIHILFYVKKDLPSENLNTDLILDEYMREIELDNLLYVKEIEDQKEKSI